MRAFERETNACGRKASGIIKGRRDRRGRQRQQQLSFAPALVDRKYESFKINDSVGRSSRRSIFVFRALRPSIRFSPSRASERAALFSIPVCLSCSCSRLGWCGGAQPLSHATNLVRARSLSLFVFRVNYFGLQLNGDGECFQEGAREYEG